MKRKYVRPAKKHAIPNEKLAILVQFIYCLPCIVYIAVVILIVRAHLCENLTFGEFWSHDNDVYWDLSAWWKSRIIVFCSIASFAILLWRVLAGSIIIKKTILYIPMAVYVISVILSFAFSQYKKIAWSGTNERYEGTYILVCYIFMLFYTINTIDTKQTLKIILYAVIISQLLLQILGIAQLTGNNPFNSVIGQKIVFPNYTIYDRSVGYDSIWQQIDAFAKETPPRSLLFSPGTEIYQTVYNSNYVSFYLCVIIPVYAMLFIFCSGNKQKIAMAVMLALSCINISGARSSGGVLGLAIAFIAAVITFRKHIIKWRYQLLAIIVLAGISLISTDRYMRNTNRGSILRELGGQITRDVSTDSGKDKFDYFITNNDNIVASVNDHELSITVNENASYLVEDIRDSQGNQINLRYDYVMLASGDAVYQALRISLVDNRFENLELFIPELTGELENRKMVLLKLSDDENIWPFLIEQDDTYFFTARARLVKLRKVPHYGFENRYQFGTVRGYIWSRTFPLMLETLFIGHGADTFAMFFPHDDFTGFYYNYSRDTRTAPLIMDKPHNFILLNFVNTGGISAIALIAILFIYLIQSFMLYNKSIRYDLFSGMGAGVYLGIIAFFVAGMVYDTSITVMPLIYGLLGIGISCNYLVKANSDAAQSATSVRS
jgi:membrane protein implicated in regulation of membrane protease activity